jgi:hypothetical protein
MMPGRYPIELYRGDTYEWRVVIWLDTARRLPFDLSQTSAKAEIRAQPGGVGVWPIECAVTAPNIIDLFLNAKVSRELPDTGGVWDLQLANTNDEIATILRGEVRIVLDVTDSRYEPVVNPLRSEQTAGLMSFPKRGVKRA